MALREVTSNDWFPREDYNDDCPMVEVESILDDLEESSRDNYAFDQAEYIRIADCKSVQPSLPETPEASPQLQQLQQDEEQPPPRPHSPTSTPLTPLPSHQSHSETTDALTPSAVVTILESPSASLRENKTKTTGKRELLYRMSMAHLAPNTVDWCKEIDEACKARQSTVIAEKVMGSLRDFPMPMSEKLALHSHLQGQYSEPATHNGGGLTTRNKVYHSDTNKTSQHKGNTLLRSRKQNTVSSIVYSDNFGTLGIWSKPIGAVTAFFGTNVASYFKFLRFLTFLNTWAAIIMFGFVSLPQIIPDELMSDAVKTGFFGKLSQTIFFYGAYSNSSLGGDVDDDVLVYDRPLAYFLTWCSIYILSIFFIVLMMYINYRKSKQSFSDTKDRYAAATLIGWDHSVTSKEGCRLKASALTTYIREIKLEDVEKRKMAFKDRCSLFVARVLCNVACLTIMGGSGYLIYYVADMTIKSRPQEASNIKQFFLKYRLTLVVSALKIAIPPVLSLLLYFEKLQPRTAIKVQLARTYVFYAASLLAFLVSVYAMSTQCEGDSDNAITTARANTSASLYLPKMYLGNTPKEDEYCCWENMVGEQLFQVVIVDLVANVGVGLVMMAGRALVVQRCFRFRMLGYAEFNVAAEILDLVYGQALVWLGLYTAPFLTLVGVVKLIFQFYFFYGMASSFCDPPTSIFRASRSGGFFLFVLLVTLFFCMFPLTYMIVSLQPSDSCGPFKMHDRVYEVLTDRIGDAPDWLQTIIQYISTPAVVIPVILLLLLLVFYYRVKSSTQKRTAKNIRTQFKMKRQVEKKQLFSNNRIQRVTHSLSCSGGLAHRDSRKNPDGPMECWIPP